MITLSGPHLSARSAMQQRPNFAGQGENETKKYLEAKQEKYAAKIRQFPPDTIEKMADIIQLSGQPKHIRLAKEYAKEDENIAYLNKKIEGSVSKRSRNPLAGEKLKVFRDAIKTVMQERGYNERGQKVTAIADEPARPSFLQSVGNLVANVFNWLLSPITGRRAES